MYNTYSVLFIMIRQGEVVQKRNFKDRIFIWFKLLHS